MVSLVLGCQNYYWCGWSQNAFVLRTSDHITFNMQSHKYPTRPPLSTADTIWCRQWHAGICERRPCYPEISGTGLQTTSEKTWLWTSDWTGKACPLIVAFATMRYLYFRLVNTAIIETTTTACTHGVTCAPSAIPIVEQIVLCKHKVTQSMMLLLPICHPTNQHVQRPFL